MVEHQLPKLRVVGSSPIARFRSIVDRAATPSDPTAVAKPLLEDVAVTEAVATERSGEVDQVWRVRITCRLPPLANGRRLAPVLLLLDRAEKMLSA